MPLCCQCIAHGLAPGRTHTHRPGSMKVARIQAAARGLTCTDDMLRPVEAPPRAVWCSLAAAMRIFLRCKLCSMPSVLRRS
jgi:hypothetical protein